MRININVWCVYYGQNNRLRLCLFYGLLELLSRRGDLNSRPAHYEWKLYQLCWIEFQRFRQRKTFKINILDSLILLLSCVWLRFVDSNREQNCSKNCSNKFTVIISWRFKPRKPFYINPIRRIILTIG